MVIANIIVGLALLILGKRIFWLFVGAIGFIGASNTAAMHFGRLPDWQILIISIAAGLLGVLLALFFQKLAILLVGFYAGGYLVVSLLSTLNIALPPALPWMPFVIGGLLGAVLLYLLFDWTLIVLSSFAGAIFISQTIQTSAVLSPIIMAALFLAGVIIQGSMLKKRKGWA
ncbi:MAG: DUF4203 domain-containing protein [Deltaproteobacteria bacterium]|nr:DUF4203 domain-containing protein [Deltaproteobacteria bacterium]